MNIDSKDNIFYRDFNEIVILDAESKNKNNIKIKNFSILDLLSIYFKMFQNIYFFVVLFT